MSFFLFIMCFAIFLMIAPCLFAIRYVRSQPAWWVIYLMIALIGWVATNGTVYFYYEHLRELLSRYDTPPSELVDRLVNDGAKRVFALIFGWLYAILYSFPWLAAYFIMTKVRERH